MSAPRQLAPLPSMRGQGPPLRLARRRRGRRRVLVVAGLLVVGAVGLQAAERATSRAEPPATADAVPSGQGAADGAVVAEAPRATGDGGDGARGGEAAAAGPATPAVPTLATVDGLVVSVPSPEVLLVGYHEASLTGALELHPTGRLVDNANPTRFTAPETVEGGTEYHVMSSRGRALPATSAVDLVMRDDTPVLAPVDGIVTEVRPYQLYGAHDDTRIEIRPEAAPHLRVVLIHVADVQVRPGERVRAGQSVLAGTANRFPFASHVDRYLELRWPHVHLEVKDPELAAG